ncbi:MAG: chorismate synthase [Clostridia bacterium]|nr:chorismate synthase [Clostridia bacterium]
MKNTFGNNITVTLFGESHMDSIGAVLDGIPAGIKIDTDFIKNQLSKRRPHKNISTSRVEIDEFDIISGVYNDFTTGSPICIIIKNGDKNSNDYNELESKPRPSHADYSAFCKYGKYGVLPGGGHFSGRITAPLVAVGAIAISVLNGMGIKIASHLKRIGNIEDDDFFDFEDNINKLNSLDFPVINESIGLKMQEKIKSIKADNDSIGGIVETLVLGMPSGVGEPWFDSVESLLSHALFSIPSIKAVEFGLGFGFADLTGFDANDSFEIIDGKVLTKTNNNGGINGGITNGNPLMFRVAVKPTPSIQKEQDTVDLDKMSNCKLTIKGRHDPCIAHRVGVVIDSVAAITLLDLLAEKYGTEGIKNAIRTDREDIKA